MAERKHILLPVLRAGFLFAVERRIKGGNHG
jgi:hypothetical protein